MATQSPDSFVQSLLGKLGEALQPPAWVVEELQRSLVLALNHVLQQEPEAQARLRRQAGRLVEAHWRMFSVRLRCPWCGETHDCRVVDGRAPGRELSARGAAVPPSKSVSPPG